MRLVQNYGVRLKGKWESWREGGRERGGREREREREREDTFRCSFASTAESP